MNLYLIPIIYALNRPDDRYYIYVVLGIYLLYMVILKKHLNTNIIHILIQLGLILGLHLLTNLFLNVHDIIKCILYSLIISFDSDLNFIWVDFVIHLLTLTMFLYVGNYTYKRLNFPKDSLTNLQRYGYLNHIDEQLNKDYEMLSILFIDIDDFKQINDTYGHDIGNSILIELSRFLRLDIRPTDSIIRYGGEEFVIILKNTKINSAIKIAERLRKGIENHIFPIGNKTTIKITVSIGISSSDQSSKDLFALIKIADQNLYRAKSLGKNCIYPSDY